MAPGHTATGYTAIARGWRFVVVLALLATSAFLSLPSSAAQVALPPSLTGENLDSYSFYFLPGNDFRECSEDGSTLAFFASGVTTGPYPGTFEARGTVTLGADTQQLVLPAGADGTIFSGPVVAFEETFTIISGETTITGTKQLTYATVPAPYNIGIGPGGLSVNTGACAEFYYQHPDDPYAQYPQHYFISAALVSATYDATIETPTGTFRDRGLSSTALNYSIVPYRFFGVNAHTFDETFFSTSLENVATPPASLTLTPPAATNPVGTSHTVTATALNVTGQPVQGATVRFAVTGSTTTSSSCTTDANGQCSFTYQGPALPGADLITACADTNNSGACDPGEPVGEATKAWVLPVSTPGQVTGGGQVVAAGGAESVAFGFNAQSTDRGLKGTCTVIDQATDTKVKCLDVTALVQAPATAQGGGSATFFGNATVNGVPTTYRIDVTDAAEPGAGRDTFAIQTASGYAAGGILAQGNIQVHRAR